MSKAQRKNYNSGDYCSPVDDVLFVLNQAAGVDRLEDWDAANANNIIDHAARFVDGVVAPGEPDLDNQPPWIEEGRVRVSSVACDIVRQYADNGWYGINVAEEFGGQGLADVLGNVVLEMVSGASLNISMNVTCPPAALKLVAAEGSDEQKLRYIPGLISGEYSATIVLSEPQAGSDLRLIRTTASQNQDGDVDGSWRLTGGKVFCSNGDQDITSNILHCILARTEEAPEGSRGLSLFLCPAVLPDGSRNNISVSRLEEKMGLHGSPTCQINFDNARAEMVGDVGEGLGRMFTMMNAMRLDVAIQAIGLCQVALQRSHAYAADRRQGRSLDRNSGADDPQPIDQHGDIRRMLIRQRALTMGCRAMTYKTAVDLGIDQRSPLAAMMLPVCKVFTSDAATECADMAIQIHGGYGYIKDYRVEQIARDARISRIYEGANGLHATNLAVSLQKSGGQLAAEAFAADIGKAIEAASSDELTATATALQRALDHWQQASTIIADMPDPGFVAYDYMRLTGLLAFATAWSRMEAAADAAPDPEDLIEQAAFVREYMLPETEYLLRIIKATTK
ncbi:MAG: acyl-CoA dehydrogenase [Alphaproteobacteria bacterium]|jgi:3-(methylthio)propanoyl-CoA dehydrogenase|nr:acyl-CoA dehydrogenase [Alphaproteobacteria bacterium]MBT4083850.1 acyl-CoA dehydrogenase [Alphaproteobacteria bacterium]MBT4542513.1 acyl-CoA dehydrogenase [Alphaproteobacteria bacterium]MBT6242619.1 acyl-CoA dehydrogenase [Rhodospirillaceae bacterium]MBT7745086.1 acyl-CoA dehydrogenase [Alphaproteobacteria bacterium]